MNLTALRIFFSFLFVLIIPFAVLAQPANDAFSAATQLTSGMTPTAVPGNLYSGAVATGTTGINTFCTSITSSSADVWYYFVARSTFPTVTLTGMATNNPSLSKNVGIQLFNTNSTNSSIVGTISVATLNSNNAGCYYGTSGATQSYTPTSALTPGNIYLLRIASGVSITSSTTRWAFSIQVIDPIFDGGRSNEVFKQTILSGAGILQYPWEITYGPDDQLWITESKGYKVYRMDPNTGTKTTVLDLNSTSTDLSSWGADSLRAVGLSVTGSGNWSSTVGYWPQGGLAGLAIHPNFGDGSGHDFVYISYVHRYLSTASGSAGIFFRNKIVRFTYNSGTGKLGTPAVVCDTIPGGQDHNSQRMIIAPVTAGGTEYLFYAAGDMGAGQYGNRLRPQKAQNIDSYEGKILRFNLDTTGMPGPNKWIPSDNPYSSASAVYSIGIRNNQGFAYDTSLNILYGASHGPYSDDEINVIESFRNYGHPLIQGFVDGNYNGNSAQGTSTSYSAGAGWNDNSGVSSCPPIGNEDSCRTVINGQGHGLYKDPLFSAYAAPLATVANVWTNNIGGNPTSPIVWPTEAWSGLDIYSNKIIPGWKRSLIAASLKLGRLVRLKLGSTGLTTMPNNNESDTITYFNSKNRFRDLAIAPNGKDIFIVMDNNSATSGPGQSNPVVPACGGCVQKYTFLGYNSDASGKSMISNTIDVAAGTANACQNGTTITIDYENANLWVPITGADGNILAEIKANGNILGTVTTSFYTKTGSVRENGSKRLYASRNITITPQTQPSSAVSIRLYLTAAEFNSLKTATNSLGNPSGINTIADVSIFKNSDACGSAMTNTTTIITPQYAEAFGNNYVLQGDITSFSSFYFASASTVTLPVQLITFSGSLQENNTSLLQWTTSSELNTSNFVIERSIDGNNFSNIASVNTVGNRDTKTSYSFIDMHAGTQPTSILYYRLKIVDNDGKYSYSKVISIVLNKNIDVLLFPNPAKHNVNVQVKGAVLNPVIIQVTDLNGRVVYSEKRNITQSGTVTIDVKQWKSQVYILKVTNAKNEVISTQKFEKM